MQALHTTIRATSIRRANKVWNRSSQPLSRLSHVRSSTPRNHSKQSWISSSAKPTSRFVRYYSKESEEKAGESSSEQVAPPSIKPVQTTMPKAFESAKRVKRGAELGAVQIGTDGVVKPAEKPPSVAASQFQARTVPASQEEVLKRMLEINKKQLANKKTHDETKAKSSAPRKPEIQLYGFTPRRWVAALNGVACLASVRTVQFTVIHVH